ncbi:hypothetical protein [Leucothrix arctica]|uniref:Lipoprotein n=1 Tax=Leucothrix arctica TaxID=1481894 RepID=A0A317CJ49_9GAMM|nr:hypothetical protein [Leucothrix arctica]PWQ96350.1 hypothetical protein DKT75_10220 [Leucothrix arctica]
MIKLLTKIIATGAVAATLSGCGSSAYDYRKTPISDTITVPLGKTVQAQNSGLSVTFDKIGQDSRCPINARCTWSGVAVVDATVKQGDKSQKIKLSTVNFEAFNNTEKVFGKDIKLIELLPNKTAGAAKPEMSQTTIKLKID